MPFLDAVLPFIWAFKVAVIAGLGARVSYRLWPILPLALGIAVAGVLWSLIELNFVLSKPEAQDVHYLAYAFGMASFGWFTQVVTALGFVVLGVLLWDVSARLLSAPFSVQVKLVGVVGAVAFVLWLLSALPRMGDQGKDELAAGVVGVLFVIGGAIWFFKKKASR